MTSEAVSRRKRDQESGRQLSPEQAAAAAMVAEARARGLELTGPNGLLKLFTKNVLETALGEELTEHLGHPKNYAEPGRESTNVRNGSRPKKVISDAVGEVTIEVPRDREGTFEPQIVKKRQRRLTDVDEVVLSLYAKGLTTGEISAHFAEIYGASVSKETISRITDAVVAEMQDWAARPLDGVYVAVFIDAIMVKVRDGQVANRPVYAAIGVTLDGCKDVLGLWMGVGGEGAKFWMSVLTDLRNRGVRDVFFLVCDGLKGLPDVVEHVWPQTVVQTCIIHLIRNTFRLASRADHDAIKKDLKAISPRRPQTPPSSRWKSSRKSGARSIGRSSGCGAARGPSSSRSSIMTSKSDGSSAARTPSRASTPVTGERYGPGGISPPSKRR
jgi:putative transposase